MGVVLMAGTLARPLLAPECGGLPPSGWALSVGTPTVVGAALTNGAPTAAAVFAFVQPGTLVEFVARIFIMELKGPTTWLKAGLSLAAQQGLRFRISGARAAH